MAAGTQESEDPIADDGQSPPSSPPTWFRPAINACVKSLRETIELIEVSRDSIVRTTRQVPLIEALARLDESVDPHQPLSADSEAEIDRARKQAATAQEVMDSDFRLLHSNGIVLIWAYLEALVNDLLLSTILNNPNFYQYSDWSYIKLPVARFVAMTREDQAEYLATEVSQSLLQRSRSDSTQLEKVLELAGLGGPFPDNLKTSLYILQKVRNLIAHRGGTADSRFREDCPMLDAETGTKLQVDHHSFVALGLAAVRYVHLIEERCCQLYGGAPRGTVFDWTASPIDVVSAFNTQRKRSARTTDAANE